MARSIPSREKYSARPAIPAATAQRVQAGIFDPIEKGIITWDKVHELGEILDGSFPGRTNDQQITLFESQGLAIQDMAAAAHVYEQAVAQGLGREVDFLSGEGH